MRFQSQALTEGISRTVSVQWTVINEGGRGTRAQIPLYDNPAWAKAYDVVVHNECFADVTTRPTSSGSARPRGRLDLCLVPTAFRGMRA